MTNKISDDNLISCKFASNLFEYSTKVKECSSKVFIKAFIYSSVAKRISEDSFIFDSLDVVEAYNLIKREKKLTRGDNIYPSYVMSWIGYIMEYFTKVSKLPLTVLYRKIKPEEFYMLYQAYHSLDNNIVIKKICEAKGINLNFNKALKDIEILKEK